MVNLGSLPLINPKAEMSNALKLTFRSNALISVSDLVKQMGTNYFFAKNLPFMHIRA